MAISSNVSLVDLAYQEIKSQILNGHLLPDSVLDEAVFAEALGASRTPVRQALNRLSGQRFVRILPQRGTLVNRVTVADIQQVYLIRRLLEPEASYMAAHRADLVQIDELRVLDNAFVSSDESHPDLDKHTEFHVAVAATAGVPRLTRIIADLQEQVQWFMTVHAAEGGAMPPRHHHRELVEAIAAGDGTEARRITEGSIQASRKKLLRGVIGDPEDVLEPPASARTTAGSSYRATGTSAPPLP